MTKKAANPGTPIPASPQAPMNWAGHTFTASASASTGNLEMRWLRSGNTLTIETLRYKFTSVPNHNKANINIVVDAHSAGDWKLNSPDNRIQDGQWHTWGALGALALGNSTRITVKVVFIFDKGGPDDRGTATFDFSV
ncbi:MAG: hypothetical protein WBB95_10725 [Pseudomonas sp.]|uniref:hypothetical protein n=1 Tax=Pseudomonas sp. TaxID=306 RepID=UPI003C736FCB